MDTIFPILIIAGLIFLVVLSAALWTYFDMKKNPRRPTRILKMLKTPDKSLEPTAAPLSGLARLPFRAAGSSRSGSALIR
jgi:hypothetical protein